MSKNQHQSQQDPNQILVQKFDASRDADRVFIVGGDKFNLEFNEDKLINAVKDGLKHLKIENQQPQVTMVEPKIIEKIVYKEIDKPYIVKEIEYKEVQIPVVIEKIVFKEIEKPIIVEKIVYKTNDSPINIINPKEEIFNKRIKIIQTIVLIGIMFVAIFK